MGKDRKREKRVRKDFGVNIVAVDHNGKSLGLGWDEASETAGTGFSASSSDKTRITSSKPLPRDSKMQMKMFFPEEKELNLIKANGTVKWVKQVKRDNGKFFLIGVHFKEISSREKSKITKLWKTHRAEI